MTLDEAKKKLETRKRAIMKAARDLQIAFNAEREAVDRLYKEFTKLAELQRDGYISNEFVLGTQASKAWLYKAGMEEQIRLDLPWRQGKAVIDPSALKPLAEVFEANFSNLAASLPDGVDAIEVQAQWEADNAAMQARRWAMECIKSGVQAGMGDNLHPESDELVDYVVNFWMPKHHPDVEVSRELVRETLEGLGYFDPNVTMRGRTYRG